MEFPYEIHRRRQRGGVELPRACCEDQGGEETRWRRRSRRSPRAHQIAPRELRRRIEGWEMRELQRQNPESWRSWTQWKKKKTRNSEKWNVTGWLRELMRDWAEGEGVSEWGWGLREGGVTFELLLKKWEIRNLGLDYRSIYIGVIFVISWYRVFIRAGFWVGSRIFFYKTRTWPEPASRFFFFF